MKIDVRNNNVDKALKILKKKLQEDGVFNEMRDHEFHMTKGEKKRKSLAAAIRRDQKLKQKRFEEFGY